MLRRYIYSKVVIYKNLMMKRQILDEQKHAFLKNWNECFSEASKHLIVCKKKAQSRI